MTGTVIAGLMVVCLGFLNFASEPAGAAEMSGTVPPSVAGVGAPAASALDIPGGVTSRPVGLPTSPGSYGSVPAGPTALTEPWSVQAAPNVRARLDDLRADSCPTAIWCMAVGADEPEGFLSEVRVRGAWHLLPVPAGVAPTAATAVSCSSANACTAVGNNQSGVMVAYGWNGTAWSVQTTPPLAAGSLNADFVAVSCSSARACTAVGSYHKTGVDFGLAERWDGSAWTIQTVPSPAGAAGALLSGVSCSSPTACVAVGEYYTKTTSGPYAATWDGTTWSAATVPVPGGAATGNSLGLTSVSCSSSVACTAVGTYNSGPLVTRWDGTAWTVETAPAPGSPGEPSSLASVACSSSTACVAVGAYGNGGGVFNGLPWALRWDGATWTIQSIPPPAPIFPRGGLSGVACSSPTACLAVGAYETKIGNHLTFAETWNGAKWRTQAPQNPPRPEPNDLAGVSCTSATFCIAVGSHASPFGVVPLAEIWNGVAWRVQRTPDPVPFPLTSLYTSLNSVSCTSPVACIAVGYAGYTIFAERWDGRHWTLQTIPNPPGVDHHIYLNSVSCSSATSCIAVGNYYTGGDAISHPLAERWNGTTWNIQKAAVAPGGALDGVSCPSPVACTAVGFSNRGTLAESWDGTAWTIQTIPNPPGVNVQLNAVSCSSPSACTAVGDYYPGVGVPSLPATLAERWTGTDWTIQTIPTAAGGYSYLTGVSCPSANACSAVGHDYLATTQDHQVTLAESWDGATWTIQDTPSPSSGINELSAVSCPRSRTCTAVGADYPISGYSATLVETEKRVSRKNQ